MLLAKDKVDNIGITYWSVLGSIKAISIRINKLNFTFELSKKLYRMWSTELTLSHPEFHLTNIDKTRTIRIITTIQKQFIDTHSFHYK